eukprot:5156979-Pleurochrysis_carterae.AAC.1
MCLLARACVRRCAHVPLSSVGPLAARCVALLCHAPTASRLSPRLIAQLGPLSGGLSATVRAWLVAALSNTANSTTTTITTATITTATSAAAARLSSNGDADGAAGAEALLLHAAAAAAADRASAALQLLGAAAERQPELFGALCRGTPPAPML